MRWRSSRDANGADRALQEHLASRAYPRVTVYAVTGPLRNDVGHREVHSVDAPEGARGFDPYSVKDTRMAEDASDGLMVWDGRSRGTLENVRNLLAHGKPVAVHLAPATRLIAPRSMDDLRKLVATSVPPRTRQEKFRFGTDGATQRLTDAVGDGSRPGLRSRAPGVRRRVRDAGASD